MRLAVVWSRGSSSKTCAGQATRLNWPRNINLQGADELVFLDITASHEGRSTMIDVIEHMFDVFVDGHADAALAASIFHFGEYSVGDTKKYLDDRSVPVRIVY